MYVQLVTPNTGVHDSAGMCLQFVQSVYSAPIRYRSAWDAWLAISDKHENRAFPNASVPVWFSHFGTYGNPPSYENWGHVVAYVPGKGFLSSPGQGYGQEWLKSIAEVERRFNSKFAGWSESLNGLKIVEYQDDPHPEKDENNMALCVVANADESGHFAIYSDHKGWQNLDFAREGGAEVRGYQKIADAMNAGKPVPVAVLSGEEWIYTQGHATRK